MQISDFKGQTFEATSSLEYDYMCYEETQYGREYCVAGHHTGVIVVSSSRVKGVQSKFGIAETQSTKVSFAARSATTASTSAAVNKYLRQSPPFHPYIRQTLNPVWDAFTAI